MVENEKVEEMFLTLEDKLEKTVSVLREEFSNIRAGRANPHVLDKIQVGTHESNPTVIQCTDCESFVLGTGDCCH